MIESQAIGLVKPLFAKHILKEAVTTVSPQVTKPASFSSGESAGVPIASLINVWQARMALIARRENIQSETKPIAMLPDQDINNTNNQALEKASFVLNYPGQTMEVIQWAQNILDDAFSQEGKEGVIQDPTTTYLKLEKYGVILRNPDPEKYSQADIEEARRIAQIYQEQRRQLDPNFPKETLEDQQLASILMKESDFKYRKKVSSLFLEMIKVGTNLDNPHEVALVKDWLNWEFLGLINRGNGYELDQLDDTMLNINGKQIELKFHGKGLLKPEEHGAWKSENANRLKDAFFEAMQASGLELVFPDIRLSTSRAADFPNENISPKPSVWLEYYDSNKPATERRQTILTWDEYMVFITSRNKNLPLKLNFRQEVIESISNEATPLAIRRGILQKMVSSLEDMISMPKQDKRVNI